MMYGVGLLRVTLVATTLLQRNICNVCASDPENTTPINFKQERESHVLKTLTSAKYARLAGLSEMNVFKNQILRPMLIERVSDTDGNIFTQEHIKYWMGNRLGWHIEEDSFEEMTPYNLKNFRNIIARLDPNAKRFLTMVCHFDSKYFEEFEFVAATDSAVPCAMMIDLAKNLNYSLHNGKDAAADGVSLQFIFLDGEEAFKEWTATDSIYGARHLAEKWQSSPHPHDSTSNVLDAIDAFVLLDLIGAKNPRFLNFFPKQTDKLFKRLQSIESKLHKAQLLESHYSNNEYFVSQRNYGHIEDDHIPFLRKNVPVLHVISAPFPSVWHTKDDNEDALHYPTIDNLNKIFRIFVSEYLHLKL